MKNEESRPSAQELEHMAPEERQKYLEEKLREIIRYACKNAPAVKERFDKAGVKPEDVRTIKDLEKVPVLRKDDVIELQKKNPPFGGLLAVPLDSIERIYQSPGPIYEPDKGKSFARGSGMGSGFGKGQIVINTWSYHLVPAGLKIDQILRDMGCTVVPSGTGNTELQVQIMHDLKVTGFSGTPSFLKVIIDKAEDMGYDFKKDFNVQWAIVAGEMGGEELREMFQQKYGIFCLGGNGYGTAELGGVAVECDKKAGMHINADLIVEIVDPATGKQLGPNEIGEIVVTPFDEVYPLIRFGTGDSSSLDFDPCACGRTTPRLPKIMGRVGDAVRIRGMFVHPKQTDEVIQGFPEISRYQLVVTRPQHRDEMVLQIELANESVDREKLKSALDQKFRVVCKVRFDRVEFIAKGSIPEDAKAIVEKRTY